MDTTTVSYKLYGTKELEDALLQIAEDFGYGNTTKKVLVPAIKEASRPAYTTVLSRIPYDEGNTTTQHMRDTLRLNARMPSAADKRSAYLRYDDVAIAYISIRTDKRGISQEFGNARVRKQPFLRDSLTYAANAIIDNFGDFLKKRMTQYKAKQTKETK